jgi:hypothetical protein
VARRLLDVPAMPNPIARVLVPTVVGVATMWVSTADAKPAWCGEGSDQISGHGPRDAVKDKDPRDALIGLAKNLCNPDDEGKQMYRELEAAAKKWSEKLDLTEADWKDVVDLAVQPGYMQMSDSLSMDLSSRSLSSLDAIEQFTFLKNHDEQAHYYMDALGPKLTETGRMAYVIDCTRDRTDYGVWAVCQPDVDAFDFKKVSSELRTQTKRSGYERMLMRFIAYKLPERIAEHTKKVEALEAKDEGYAKLFAVAPDIHKAWASRYSSDVYALALKMDDGKLSNSRKAFAGCEDATRSAWDAAVGKLPAKSFEGLVEDPGVKLWAEQALAIAIRDTDVYLASIAMFMCHNQEGDPPLLPKLLSGVIAWNPGLRGPRTESHTQMIALGITPDNRTEQITFPSMYREWLFVNGSRSGGAWGRGEVGKMTKEKDGDTTIAFKAEWAEQTVCTKWKETNKFGGWDTAGRPYYRSVCLGEKTEKVNRANDPVKVKARSMTGVKKGAYIIVDDGDVSAVFAKKGAKVPSAVFGVAVK